MEVSIAERRLSKKTYLGLATLSALLGVTFAQAPLAALAAAAGGAFLLLCFHNPFWAFGIFVFAHIAVPIYVRPPPIGPLPPPPIALSMLIALTIATALAVTVGRGLRRRQGLPRLLLVLLILFGAIGVLSLFNERTTSVGVNTWFKAYLFPLVLLLVAERAMRGARDVDRIFRIMLVASCIISLYAIWEFAVGENPLLEKFLVRTGLEWEEEYRTAADLSVGVGYRSFSVFSQPIEFGLVVGMVYPYAVMRVATAHTAWERCLFALAAVICLIGIATTLSRGAILAVVVLSFGLALLQRALWRGAFFVSTIGLVSVALAWPWIGEGLTGRLRDVENVTLRFKLWQTAAAIFIDNPLIGVGIGNFPQYEIDAIRKHKVGPFTEFGAGVSGKLTHVVDSFYFQLAAEMGLGGLLSVAAVIVVFFIMAYRIIRQPRDELERNIGMCLGAGVVAYVINAFTVTAYLMFTATMMLIGIFFASMLVLYRERQDELLDSRN